MNLYKLCRIVLSLFLYAYSLHSFALPTRTWVSAVGDDINNPCSRTAPCKTFSGALAKTEPGGEIGCLDSANFGPVTITKSISIYCTGVIAGVQASAVNAISINASATDKVVLNGLDLDGIGSGLSGVNILNAASVTIANSFIRNFTTSGVNLNPSASPVNVTVINTIVSGNAIGVRVDGTNGAAVVGLVNSVITANTNTTSTINGGKVVSYAAGNVIKD